MRTHALLVASLLASTAVVHAAQQKHPHFDDGGTLPWFKSLAEAKAAAKMADKVILVEYGREA